MEITIQLWDNSELWQNKGKAIWALLYVEGRCVSNSENAEVFSLKDKAYMQAQQ